MRPIFLSLLFVLSAACGGSDGKGDTSNSKTVDLGSETTNDCAQEIALECAEGTTDGCGLIDESGTALTLAHICVQATETHSQPPCEQEIARVCEEGFIDACLLMPAAAATHVCVVQPESSEPSIGE